MSGDHTGPAATIAARVRHVEALLERRGLVDPQELDRALEVLQRVGKRIGILS